MLYGELVCLCLWNLQKTLQILKQLWYTVIYFQSQLYWFVAMWRGMGLARKCPICLELTLYFVIVWDSEAQFPWLLVKAGLSWRIEWLVVLFEVKLISKPYDVYDSAWLQARSFLCINWTKAFVLIFSKINLVNMISRWFHKNFKYI